MDRKAWIILLLCGLALAINLKLGQDNARKLQEQREREAAEQVEKGEQGEQGGQGEKGNSEAGAEAGGEEAPVTPSVEEKFVELKTDETVFRFSSKGGGLKTAEMVNQQTVGDADENVKINGYGTQVLGALTRGPDRFVGADYEVVSSDEKHVVFATDLPNGVRVTKKWSLLDGEEVGAPFRLALELTMKNGGEESVQMGDYGLGLGSAGPLYQREWDNQTGVFYKAGEDYQFESAKWFKGGKRPLLEQQDGSIRYAGVTNQFFASIFTPESSYDGTFWAKRMSVEIPESAGGGEKSKEGVFAGLSLPAETLPTGGVKAVSFEVYTGPKKNPLIRDINPEFGSVMNYGWPVFRGISHLLNLSLNWIHDTLLSGLSNKWSWAVAIILLTIVIRGLMWPLQNKSTRSMKRMAKLKEPMAELKEKYADDPQKMNQEMMKLYREYGINPLGGCLPLLVQIPIFFGFFQMLKYAVELRQQPFLWVEDLSQPDTLATVAGFPINVLPIVMAGTMLIQMAITPKTGDKMQTRIFMLMPIIFLIFCYNFASALALYWTTSNIFAIVQTFITQRMPEPELKKKKKKGPGFMERMQARAEEMQKHQKAQRRAQQGGGGPKSKKPRGPRTGG